MRGTVIFSPAASARRSAFEMTFSSSEIGRRWLTPDRLSIFWSCRAWNATSSTTSRTYSGTESSAAPVPRSVHASWRVICIAC